MNNSLLLLIYSAVGRCDLRGGALPHPTLHRLGVILTGQSNSVVGIQGQLGEALKRERKALTVYGEALRDNEKALEDSEEALKGSEEAY